HRHDHPVEGSARHLVRQGLGIAGEHIDSSGGRPSSGILAGLDAEDTVSQGLQFDQEIAVPPTEITHPPRPAPHPLPDQSRTLAPALTQPPRQVDADSVEKTRVGDFFDLSLILLPRLAGVSFKIVVIVVIPPQLLERRARVERSEPATGAPVSRGGSRP